LPFTFGTVLSSWSAVWIAAPTAVPPRRGQRVVSGRRLEHRRRPREREHAHLDGARHAREEPPRRLHRRALARRGHVGRLHRAADVVDQHDRAVGDGLRDASLGTRGRHDQDGQRDQEDEHRQVPPPARSARRDGGGERRGGECRRRARPPALLDRVPLDEQRDRQQRQQDKRIGEAHGDPLGRAESVTWALLAKGPRWYWI
jgi:hypothetical protein